MLFLARSSGTVHVGTDFRVLLKFALGGTVIVSLKLMLCSADGNSLTSSFVPCENDGEPPRVFARSFKFIVSHLVGEVDFGVSRPLVSPLAFLWFSKSFDVVWSFRGNFVSLWDLSVSSL